MMDCSETFWKASVNELKQGYIFNQAEEVYQCLVCNDRHEKGIIYTVDGQYYEAEKFTQLHIVREHSSMFDFLTGLDKKITGLTELQKKLIHYFYSGLKDNEIVAKLEGGSASTVRNHRFSLRESMKQAKVFLAIMELIEDRVKHQTQFLAVPRTVDLVDQRYEITEEENFYILKANFKQGLDGPINHLPKKQKHKIAVLKQIMTHLDPSIKYSEKEINKILKRVYQDYVTLRRYLVDYGFLDRKPDGSEYWVKFKPEGVSR